MYFHRFLDFTKLLFTPHYERSSHLALLMTTLIVSIKLFRLWWCFLWDHFYIRTPQEITQFKILPPIIYNGDVENNASLSPHDMMRLIFCCCSSYG